MKIRFISFKAETSKMKTFHMFNEVVVNVYIPINTK